jgi:hypothetical protein
MRNKCVAQIHPNGCGVACVAQILAVTYNQALRFFRNGESAAVLRGFYCKDIVKALKLAGRNYRFFYVNQKRRGRIYKNGTVVLIARSRRYPQGHYLARVKNRWMDSWINWPDVTCGRAGFRRRLPGRPIYGIAPDILK